LGEFFFKFPSLAVDSRSVVVDCIVLTYLLTYLLT